MKKKRTMGLLVTVFALVAAVVSGCGKQAKAPDKGKAAFSFEFAEWVNPEQKNIWSTEQQQIQKDLVADGVSSGKWVISEKDLAAVEALVREYQVSKLSEKLSKAATAGDGAGFMTSPTWEFSLSFALDGQRYSVTGTIDSVRGLSGYSDFFDKLFVILEGQETYKALPAANGAYN